MVFELSTEWIVILASITGSAAATLYPYWEKLRVDPELLFEKKFLGTAIVSIVASVALGVSIFPSLFANIPPGLSQAGIFAIVATSAFGINRGSNMMLPKPSTDAATLAKALKEIRDEDIRGAK